MGQSPVKGNELEPLTTLAAKAFARLLELEKREGTCNVFGRDYLNSLDDAMSAAPEDITWRAMGWLENSQPGSFTVVWERIKEYARNELETGARAAAVAVEDQKPLPHARFLMLREKYIREWEPRNVLESQMIDAVCQAQTIREYWLKISIQRAAFECERERYSIQVNGKWKTVEVDGSQAAREASEEAERWDRVFIRSVRALRDLRRYTVPVIVNNQGGQVNVASNGGQQTNVIKDRKKKAAKPQGTSVAPGRRLRAVK